jgi:hypothetical protein
MKVSSLHTKRSIKEKEQEMNKNNFTKTIFAIIGLTIMSSITMPAFATLSTSSPPWNTVEESPSYSSGSCTGSSHACAYAPTSAADKIISQDTNLDFGYTATARNNQNFGSNSVGISPSVTTSASSIEGSVYVNANAVFTKPAGGYTAYYQYGGDLWKLSGGTWQNTNGFAYQFTSSFSGNAVVHQTYSNSGSNSYRLGAEQVTYISNCCAQTVKVDAWNNSPYATVTQLKLCDTPSQPCP